MNIIEKMKFTYHMTKVKLAIIKGDKKKYDKHSKAIMNIIWDNIMRAI